MSRRDVLIGGTATMAAAFVVGDAVFADSAEAGIPPRPGHGGYRRPQGPLLGFESLPPDVTDAITVPEGYEAQALVPWGDPIRTDGPAFAEDASNSSDDQLEQLGMGHDGVCYLPLAWGAKGSRRGLLVINHEFTTANLLFPDGNADWTAEKTLKEQYAHGLSIVKVINKGQGWKLVDSPSSRRITTKTVMELTGPAAGHRLLKNHLNPDGTTATGTINNCGNACTPWGTVVTSEENFRGYFNASLDGEYTEEQQADFDRHGIDDTPWYRWHETDPQWEATDDPQLPNMMGWMVEIDAQRRRKRPQKHTAMGRFAHEMGRVAISKRGRAVAYMGDDAIFEYLYKFVSARHHKRMLNREHISPLSEGTLYVARFDDDGTGTWMPLVHGHGPLTAENGFADQGEVMVKARLAADALGATPMDRPEWSAVNPANSEVFVTLTNNGARQEPNGPNPRVANANGHIVKIVEADGDLASTTFDWDIFLLAGAGSQTDDGSTIDESVAFGSPDGLDFDRYGRMWIQTDGNQPVECNNQMLAADPDTGEVRRFMVAVPNCEVTGVAFTPDHTTMFISIQHPGDRGTPEDPTATSSWPNGGRPRPAIVAITRTDGGIVGAS